jgi:hypothetical protein
VVGPDLSSEEGEADEAYRTYVSTINVTTAPSPVDSNGQQPITSASSTGRVVFQEEVDDSRSSAFHSAHVASLNPTPDNSGLWHSPGPEDARSYNLSMSEPMSEPQYPNILNSEEQHQLVVTSAPATSGR